MRRFTVGVLVVLAVASVWIAPTSNAQVLPDLPPLPAPPAEGNPLADLLGPASATACDTIATVYGLAGPIVSAQLPPEFQALLVETDPYLALVTYACGYLVSPPSGVVCAADDEIGSQLGVLGLPVGLPAGVGILYDTAAGIERALGRLGVDVGTEASRQLALALGCGQLPPAEEQPAAALPLRGTGPAIDAGSPGNGGGAFARPVVPAVVGMPGTPGSTTQLPGTLGRLGALRYPVRGAAAVVLALPLLLLAAAIALAPRFAPRRRHRLGGAR